MLETLARGPLALCLAAFTALGIVIALGLAGLILGSTTVFVHVRRRRAIRRWLDSQPPPTALTTREPRISDRITPRGESDQKSSLRPY